MKLSLVVLAAGKMQGKTIPVTAQEFVIGRDPQCHLRPASPLISNRHCALIQREGSRYVFVNNNAPADWTCVNEEPVPHTRDLRDGDRIQLGNVLLRFQTRANLDTARARSRRAAAAADAARRSRATLVTPSPWSGLLWRRGDEVLGTALVPLREP